MFKAIGLQYPYPVVIYRC